MNLELCWERGLAKVSFWYSVFTPAVCRCAQLILQIQLDTGPEFYTIPALPLSLTFGSWSQTKKSREKYGRGIVIPGLMTDNAPEFYLIFHASPSFYLSLLSRSPFRI